MGASERVRQELEDAIQQLGGLRNAGTRSPEFKQWRQNALTLVQRLWPGDVVRSERFRRIPFSFPSSQADAKTVREYYERGCAEALQLLKAFLAEAQGLPAEMPDAASGPPGADHATESASEPQVPPGPIEPSAFTGGVADKGSVISPIGADVSFERPMTLDRVLDFDTPLPRSLSRTPASDETDILSEGLELDLPAQPAAPPSIESAPAPIAQAPPPLPVAPTPAPPAETPVQASPSPITRVADMPPPPLIIEPSPLDQVEEPPGPIEPERPAPPPPAEKPAKTAAKGMRATMQRRLKEMLGLDEFEREVRAEPPASKKPARAGNGDKKEAAPDVRPVPPAAAQPPAPAPTPPPPSEAPSDDRTVGQVTSDFLDASPVLRATGRPISAREGVRPSELGRDVALAVDKLSRMVGDLDVPEGRRAQVRAMLMGLARELDQDTPRWGAVADSIAAAMEFPPLARALLPLLLPELDRAA